MYLSDTSYSVLLPVSRGNFYTQCEDCLDQLSAIRKDDLYKIFKINIFIHSTDKSDFLTKREYLTDIILNSFSDECPAFGILPISPEENVNIAIELGKLSQSDVKVSYRKYEHLRYTVFEKEGFKELWVNGIEVLSNDADTVSSASLSFDLVNNILVNEKMSFNNIIRQWAYIGSILKITCDDLYSLQNYQLFNKVRHNYYSRFRTVGIFPAATGIGMDYDSVIIDLCATDTKSGTEIFSVHNPVQVNPYSYRQDVSSVTSKADQNMKQPPLFERAILLTDGNKWRLFVSGTASIIGQETGAIGKLREQTLITIENIKKLTSKENLRSWCPATSFSHEGIFSRIRVYVKNAGDIPEVKSVCAGHFGNVPAVYVQADICRNDLLVEIEAELAG